MTTNQNRPTNGTDPDELAADGAQRDQSDTTSSGRQSDGGDQAELDAVARAELLAEENRRLRAEYARARQSKYRRTALGLAVVAVVAIIGGIVFPAGREALFAFALTGLFGAVLTLYLTPTDVVAADVGERAYAAMAANTEAIATQLGLSDRRLYVPGDEMAAHLYVPANDETTADDDLPDVEAGPIVVDEARQGLLLESTGAFLFEEFERSVIGEVATEPAPLAAQLTDGVVEQFELAAAVEPDVEPADGRLTFRISESAVGDPARFDHPLASFLAVGVVAGLGRPVQLEIAETDEYADWLVTCRWADAGEAIGSD